MLNIELISYDFIGRFESFAEDITAVLNRLNAPVKAHATAARVNNQTAKIPLAAAYDGELADSVYEFYQEDFELFSYDRDSWMLEEEFGGAY